MKEKLMVEVIHKINRTLLINLSYLGYGVLVTEFGSNLLLTLVQALRIYFYNNETLNSNKNRII